MYDAISPSIEQIREMLDQDNNRFTTRFKDLDWRFGVVVSSRARFNTMVPKYTLKFEFESEETKDPSSVIMDSDYNNLKRLQIELQDALKSINGRYSKKVFKFIR